MLCNKKFIMQQVNNCSYSLCTTKENYIILFKLSVTSLNVGRNERTVNNIPSYSFENLNNSSPSVAHEMNSFLAME
jgi:hypothetical protein